MACIEDELSWGGFTYTSSLIDFIVDDDNSTESSTRRTHAPTIKIPTKTLSEDLLDFLASEELITRTPTTASVTFRSIEDPLPSYDTFTTITNANVNKLHAALRASSPTNKTPFSPSDVLVKPARIKKEKHDSDPILNFESLRTVSPMCQMKKKEVKVKEEMMEDEEEVFNTVKKIEYGYFERENTMSISLAEISSMLPSTSELMLDSFSCPISPDSISSEGSTDTLLSSGISDQETSPRRQKQTGPTKKTRRRKATEGGNCPHLWQFILELLGDKTHNEVIGWTGDEHHFKVHNSRELARLWGARKNKPRMNFDKLSRAMRYYYDKNIIRHIAGQRLVYEFCRNIDDAVYTKLLTEASRTMPDKPIVSVPTTFRPNTQPKTTSFTAPLNYPTPPQSYSRSRNSSSFTAGYTPPQSYDYMQLPSYTESPRVYVSTSQSYISPQKFITSSPEYDQQPYIESTEEQFLSSEQMFQHHMSYQQPSHFPVSQSPEMSRTGNINLNININAGESPTELVQGNMMYNNQIKTEKSYPAYSYTSPHYTPY